MGYRRRNAGSGWSRRSRSETTSAAGPAPTVLPRTGDMFAQFEPGEFTLSGSNITQWNDLSSEGNHVVSVATHPVVDATNVLGGASTCLCAGASHLLSASFSVDATVGTIIALARKTASGRNFLCDGESSARRWAIERAAAGDHHRLNVGGSWLNAADSPSLNAWYAIAVDCVSSGVDSIWVGDFVTADATGSAGSDILRGISLGADASSALGWVGQIGAYFGWRGSVLSAAHRAQVLTYMQEQFPEAFP